MQLFITLLARLFFPLLSLCAKRMASVFDVGLSGLSLHSTAVCFKLTL